jgi:hypothetical protein
MGMGGRLRWQLAILAAAGFVAGSTLNVLATAEDLFNSFISVTGDWQLANLMPAQR